MCGCSVVLQLCLSAPVYLLGLPRPGTSFPLFPRAFAALAVLYVRDVCVLIEEVEVWVFFGGASITVFGELGPQGCAGRRVISEELLCVCVLLTFSIIIALNS